MLTRIWSLERFFWPAPAKKCARSFVCATPSTTKPGPLACARVIGGFTYDLTFVRFLERGDPTCTHTARARASERAPPPQQRARACSGHRANSIYNRIFSRLRTPKCAKLVLGASAVHVRSRLCSRFFGVGPPQNEKRAILCKKGAYCELASSSGPHPLKVGVPTALQDANRAAPVRLSSPPDVHGWRGFGETQSYAQVRRGIVLWWGVPRCRLHSGGRVQCREAVRLGVAHAEGRPLVLPGVRRGERHGHPCGKCWRAGNRHWFGGACRRLASSS